jgi:hypothetical protein
MLGVQGKRPRREKKLNLEREKLNLWGAEAGSSILRRGPAGEGASFAKDRSLCFEVGVRSRLVFNLAPFDVSLSVELDGRWLSLRRGAHTMLALN